MAFALPASSLLYPHAVTVWRYTESINATTGKIGAKTWATVATGVACVFQTAQSSHGNEGFLRDEGDNMFSLDKVRMVNGQDVQSGDVLKQTTGPEAGGFWEVRGEPEIHSQFGQYQQILCSRLPKAPNGVS